MASILTDTVGDGLRLRFSDLSCIEVAHRWASDPEFSRTFSEALAGIPFDAFFWETPVWSAKTVGQPFECVVTPAPALAKRKANPQSFAAQFDAIPPGTNVIVFESLGRDADLVVPCDIAEGAMYTHLASFLRTAPMGQATALWHHIGETVQGWLQCDRHFWLSTSGLGVSWLHVRIDQRPKYYTYEPYRQT
ncbi:hypothetical protein ABI_38590 [Asticcacaulis biprosthecium C19]|uniref:Uncharacterized protein n=1 Tax=Asticcacaulis biprosthecium C19 TaxID=715226 RepID=F4QRS5_9CAUL|nr:hypothetical protein ABI_38590 [Asticcacaulis biprosthecium C19]